MDNISKILIELYGTENINKWENMENMENDDIFYNNTNYYND